MTSSLFSSHQEEVIANDGRRNQTVKQWRNQRGRLPGKAVLDAVMRLGNMGEAETQTLFSRWQDALRETPPALAPLTGALEPTAGKEEDNGANNLAVAAFLHYSGASGWQLVHAPAGNIVSDIKLHPRIAPSPASRLRE